MRVDNIVHKVILSLYDVNKGEGVYLAQLYVQSRCSVAMVTHIISTITKISNNKDKLILVW